MMKQITQGVAVWREEIVLPTYPVGKPDKNPMFLEKRVYQGSSGRVYPHSVIDRIEDEKVDQTYHAVCLENKYLFVMILPELGGRIQRAYDKTNGYDFVYYNHVIKPALVGLAGPWISGGIEFNWPQHHRPSTFDPVDCTVKQQADGSCTVTVSEIENMFRTKGMASFTLYPDKAYIKIDAQLYNRTPLPQTFLWWANPAVPVNNDTQSVFPPDVHAVMDHGKRDVSRFPIATGVYYKQDYSAGVDISRYKNIPVPTSYMAYHSDYDFVGGYDHKKRAGILHVADHHIAPGKKQWTWGCGDFGKAWDRNLTDEDGPYIELMTGCFTDNQPDFTWLAPYEEKTFTQYFMPYKEVGMVKNATTRAAVSLSLNGGVAEFAVYASGEYPDARVQLSCNGALLYDKVLPLSPTQTLRAQVPGAGQTETALCLRVLNAQGEVLVEYTPAPKTIDEMPAPAQPVPQPGKVPTNEDLFLYGQHIEQYRHATYLAGDYYREGLRRDPTDARINNAYGLLLLRNGQFAKAKPYFEAAIRKLTRSNPNPYDSEPFYNLGVCQKLLGEPEEAYDSFYKATWSGAWQNAAFYAMACIKAASGEPQTALAHIERSLVRNAHHMKARTLKTALLRQCGKTEQATEFAKQSLTIDPMDYGARYELGAEARKGLFAAISANANWCIELALDYAEAGFYAEAQDIVSQAIAAGNRYPLLFYYSAQFAAAQGQNATALLQQAAAAPSDYCFPHRLEDLNVLQWALKQNPADAKGWYYLGDLWYDKRQYDEAVNCWQTSRGLDDTFATVHRNLALAYYNKCNLPQKAKQSMERAFALNPQDARVMMELDQLYKKLGMPQAERLAMYKAHPEVVCMRDDLYLEYVSFYNFLGDHETALQLISERKFHPWEGGEGKVPAQWVAALVGLAKAALQKGAAQKAVELLKRATIYPHNLGEGKLAGAQENNIYYYMGKAYQKLGQAENATACFERASLGLSEPAGMMYYNDQPPEMIFYQGLARLALGDTSGANSRFNRLIDYAERHLNDHVQIDYFAVSLPDLQIFEEDLDVRNHVHCLFMRGLGLLGKGDAAGAEECFAQAQAFDPGHAGVQLHRGMHIE
jgi:tetratricopeptide (TPR) repeat protein